MSRSGRRQVNSLFGGSGAHRMLDADMRDRLEAALRAHDLKGLVDGLRRAGRPQVAIYDLLETFYSELGQAGRAADGDAVGDALDRIRGWCRPGAEWFGDALTDEALRAYRGAGRAPGGPAGAGPAPGPGEAP
jgi:hypothetical protein